MSYLELVPDMDRRVTASMSSWLQTKHEHVEQFAIAPNSPQIQSQVCLYQGERFPDNNT